MTARDVVDGLLAELRENVSYLDPLRALTPREYENDVARRKMAERCLQVAIECLIDLAHHLVSEHSWGHSGSGEKALDVLASHGVIPGELRERLRGVVGFRNVLVHNYVGLDHTHVHSHLARLGDLVDFGRHVQAFVDRKP